MALKDLWRRLHEFHEEQIEIWERINLLNRPWEEDFLHWAHGEEGWVLHGRVPPPAHGHRTSVTRRGWCPGLKPRGDAGRPPSPSR